MINSLLSRLSAKGIRLLLQEEDLKVDAPKGILTEEIVKEIRAYKTEIIEYLKERKNTNTLVFRKAEEKEYYALSAAQKRMFFINKVDPENLAYNMVLTVPVQGEFDNVHVESILKKLISRHESLRTSFETVDNEPVQKIHDHVDFVIEHIDVGESTLGSARNQLIRPFDLQKPPLVRAFSVRAKDGNCLIIDIHHIITDGVSQDILTKEIALMDNGIELSPLKFQYRDYAEFQNSKEYQQDQERLKVYWLQELSTPLPVLNIPTDFDRPSVKKFEGRSFRFYLNPDDTRGLKRINADSDATMFMTVLAIFEVFLHKLSGQKDIIIGIPFSGRKYSEVNHIIGMFINTLPFRTQVDGNDTFSNYLQKIKQQSLLVFENQEYQFDNLVANLGIQRDHSRNPIYDVILEFFDKRGVQQQIDLNHNFEEIIDKEGYGQFDLSMNVTYCEAFLCFDLDYSTSLFKRSTIERFISAFKKIVSEICINPHRKIAQIEILTESEKQRLKEYNTTEAEFPKDSNLVELFERQVLYTPDNTALVLNENYSYRDLNQKANRVAHYLIANDLKEGDVVGLMINRSVEMIVAMLGIMKAGGVYMPVDPENPKERILFMLKEANVGLLLTETTYVASYPEFTVINIHDACMADCSNDNVGLCYNNNKAYIIYTSGSTGKPKGVMIKHRSVVNLVYGQKNYFRIDENERILQFSTLSFDASVEQIWLALLSGAALVLITKEVIIDQEKFAEYLVTHAITHLHGTPSFLESIKIPERHCLKRIVAGGEGLRPKLAQNLSRYVTVYNEYGPTETTVTSTILKVEKIDEQRTYLPIGKPLNNTRIYILDDNMSLLLPGVVGEMYIGGEGLAAGYIHNEVLTNERFVQSPFNKNEKLYKTGDLARWLEDGNIDFVGRTDDQVKIRGFRIELGEIESVLSQYNKVKEVVVQVRVIGNDKYIVAYYVSGEKIDAEAFRKFLNSKLPEYMIPTSFIWMQHFPLTSNGKLDKKALSEIELTLQQEYLAPENDTEKKLVEIWADILDLDTDEISTRSSFFVIGGHSLKAMKLVSRIHQEFNVAIPLQEFLITNTVKAVAEYINNEKWFKKVPKKEASPLEEFIID